MVKLILIVDEIMKITPSPGVDSYIYWHAEKWPIETQLGEDLFITGEEFYPAELLENEKGFHDWAWRTGFDYIRHMERQLRSHWDFSPIIEKAGDIPYFDWGFVPELIDPNTSGIICAGAGWNISFEIELAQRYPNLAINLFDPTPESLKYIDDLAKEKSLPPNLHVHELGLYGESKRLTFHVPSKEGAGSNSCVALNGSKIVREFDVKSVVDACHVSGFDPKNLAYLKFDIEGAEHSVIDSLERLDFLPTVIAFEFDMPVPPWTVNRRVRHLLSLGYIFLDFEGLNVLMAQRKAITDKFDLVSFLKK